MTVRMILTPLAILAVGEVASAATGSSLAEIVAQLGAVGVLAWYAVYTTRYTIPDIHSRFREDLAAVLAAHQRSIDKLTEQYERERTFFHETIERILKSHESALGEIRAAIDESQ